MRIRPLTFPDLPSAFVRLCAVSEEAPEVISALEEKGIEVIPISSSPYLPEPVASHGDMQLRTLPKGKALVIPGFGEKEHLCEKGIEVEEIRELPGKKYPRDILLNSLLLGKFCYGLRRGLASELLEYCAATGTELVNCVQGYARCSVAVAGPDLAITGDRGLYRLLSQRAIHCLLIEPGGILLPGYDTGFIGGCCGLIDKDLLAFTGNIESFHQGRAIMEFLRQHGIRFCSLTNGPMRDIGGILPLLEES